MISMNSDEDNDATVLIVDDDKFSVDTLLGILRDRYQVMVAINGEMALKAARSKVPDLILLDITMPDINGYEVFRQLSVHPITRNIPVIFITGLDSAEEEAFGLELGAVDYISKPLHASVVNARVKTHIVLRRQSKLLQEYAFKDGLTGVANRRFFDETLEKEWVKCTTSKSQLSIILLDIDYFKNFNDLYGHLEGDDCLKNVADALSICVQDRSYLLARYGGEEFVCVVPNANHIEAMHFAERLKQAILALEMPHMAPGDVSLVTASFGVATCIPDATSTCAELLAKADEMLYLSKQSGRNQVNGKFFAFSNG